MKMNVQTAAGALALALIAGAPFFGSVAALANGVGNHSGTAGNASGVGVQIGTMNPADQTILLPDVTLNSQEVQHEPLVNQPGINLETQDDPHSPSPVVPGIQYDPTGVVHNPSPVVPGIHYDPIGVVHNPSPVVPNINYAPRNVIHSPSPVLPNVQLGLSSVNHRPSVALPNVQIAPVSTDINIPIHLPNLNIDLNRMVNNITGCNPGCNSNERREYTERTWTRSEHRREETLHYRGGNTYVYVEDRTPTYTEFSFEEETLAHFGNVPLRVSCIDGSGGVHPASQVFPDEYVNEAYDGEIYRCVIGTSMHVTMGEMVDGAKNYQDGWAMTCAAGEALNYGGGELTCAPQIERRPCNERSLLRRHGPGEKVVRLNGMAMMSDSARSTLAMDGGVGAYRRY